MRFGGPTAPAVSPCLSHANQYIGRWMSLRFASSSRRPAVVEVHTLLEHEKPLGHGKPPLQACRGTPWRPVCRPSVWAHVCVMGLGGSAMLGWGSPAPMQGWSAGQGTQPSSRGRHSPRTRRFCRSAPRSDRCRCCSCRSRTRRWRCRCSRWGSLRSSSSVGRRRTPPGQRSSDKTERCCRRMHR